MLHLKLVVEDSPLPGSLASPNREQSSRSCSYSLSCNAVSRTWAISKAVDDSRLDEMLLQVLEFVLHLKLVVEDTQKT